MNRPVRTKLSAKNLLYRGVPKEFIHATIDEYPIDEDLHKLFSRYMENLDLMYDDKVNMVLYGSNGSGKTYLSSLIVKEAYRKRYTSFRVTLQNFIDMHFKKMEEGVAEKMRRIIESEFLILDEVGKETFAKNQFNIIVLEELMRQRETLGKPTILCMNLPLEDKGGFYDQYGNSIKDLISGNYLKVLFEGESNREFVTKQKKGIQVLVEEE